MAQPLDPNRVFNKRSGTGDVHLLKSNGLPWCGESGEVLWCVSNAKTTCVRCLQKLKKAKEPVPVETKLLSPLRITFVDMDPEFGPEIVEEVFLTGDVVTDWAEKLIASTPNAHHPVDTSVVTQAILDFIKEQTGQTYEW